MLLVYRFTLHLRLSCGADGRHHIMCTCSFMMEYDIHTFLDLLTLLATLLVIYMLRLPLRDSYQAAEDNIQSYVVVCGSHTLSQRSAAMQFPCTPFQLSPYCCTLRPKQPLLMQCTTAQLHHLTQLLIAYADHSKVRLPCHVCMPSEIKHVGD